MAVRKFSLPSDIYHHKVLVEWNIHGQFVRQNVDDQVNRLAGLLPGWVSAVKISFHLVETDPGKPDNTFFFFSRRGDQNDRFVKRQQTARPLGKSTVQPDTDRTRHKTCNKNL